MARTGRQDGHVARLQREYPPLVAAEPYAALAARDAEYLVSAGVVVHVVVDAIAPGICPSVRFEQVFDHGRGVLALRQNDSFSIDDKRPSRMIWNETVILKADPVRLSHFRKVHGRPLAGASQTGGTLY